MKYTRMFALAALVAALAACEAPRTDSGEAVNVSYQNGTYKATYDAMDANGWRPEIEILVRENKIVSANFDYVNKAGEFKSQNRAYADAMKARSGVTPTEAAISLIDALVDKQVPLDTVTGATGTSTVFQALAKAALAKAVTGDSTITVLPMNTTYLARKDPDARGYSYEVAVTYADGRISEVRIDSKGTDGVLKRDNADYNQRMSAANGGTTWIAAADRLQADLVAKQDPALVDAVAGATSLSATFKELAAKAVALR